MNRTNILCRPYGAEAFLISKYPGLAPRAIMTSPLRGVIKQLGMRYSEDLEM